MKRRDLLAFGVFSLQAAEKRSTLFQQEFSSQVQAVDIEIIHGDIQLEFRARPNILLHAETEYRAATAEDLALAQEEVRLVPRQQAGQLRIWMERSRERNLSRYQVRQQLRLELPSNLRVLARTAQGNVKAQWLEAPAAGAFFSTIQGEVELAFPVVPDADFRLQTYHGGLFSAFALAALPQEEDEASVTNHGLRRIVSRTRYAGGRAGRGGPRIEAETRNGDIRLVERKA